MTAPVLVLEKLMLDPRFPDVVRHVRETAPAHQRDQADAAVNDATARLLQVAQLVSDEPAQAIWPGDIPGWLRLSALDAFVGFLSGTASTCRHTPQASNPEPVYAAAWKPGLITCSHCLHLFGVGRGSAADRTCDSCGRICGGIQEDDPITPGMVQVSVVVLQFGTCGDCAPPRTGQPPEEDRPATASRPIRTRPRGRRGRSRGRGSR